MGRCLCCLALGTIAALAFGQTQPTTAPAKPDSKADVKLKPGAKTARQDQAKSDKARTQAQPERDVQQLLNGRIPEVNFEKVPLEKVMEWLQEYTGGIVYVRWKVLEDFGITRETPITVKARDKKLSQILWVIMNEAAAESGVTLAYQASTDLFLFSTHDDLSRDLVTRVYDVQDITVDVPYFKGDGTREGSEGIVRRTRVRRTAPPPSRSSGGEVIDEAPRREITTEDEKLQEFKELILNMIEPESWEINGLGGKGTIFPYKGRLVVRNSLHVHQLIDDGLKP
ncbi:MAG: hypothetical protein ACE5I3_09415 [Phycisphaerae bacterium]